MERVDLGEFKTRSISGIPDDLIEEFDIKAKRYFGSRSQAVKVFMRSFVENLNSAYEHKATSGQMTQHAVNDVLKNAGFSIKELPIRIKDTTAMDKLIDLHKRLSEILGV